MPDATPPLPAELVEPVLEAAEHSAAATEPSEPLVLSEEDRKLVTLARAGRARVGAAEGAAVRDDTGRTYAATTVDLRSLQLTAVQAAVAAAVASGARSLEAAAVVTADPAAERSDTGPVGDLGGSGTPLHVADATGVVTATLVC